uniref:Uncharacterized protein n=1 Tax=Oryza sativa subsp. japonica TaxID=39947 RepID=Q6Z7C8_ORYSJ|nr:hypothetical protein [Oryza sativa Japonica Group]BAD07920.1 hypothetical protein [Oryza sativa Japonica Group]
MGTDLRGGNDGATTAEHKCRQDRWEPCGGRERPQPPGIAAKVQRLAQAVASWREVEA